MTAPGVDLHLWQPDKGGLVHWELVAMPEGRVVYQGAAETAVDAAASAAIHLKRFCAIVDQMPPYNPS